MAKIKSNKRVTREDLEYYFALEEERLGFQRKADDCKKLIAELEKKFEAHVVANGGKEKSVLICGYRLYLAAKNGSVSWAKEFLRLCLLAKLDPLQESERLRAAAPKKDELFVEPPEETAA